MITYTRLIDGYFYNIDFLACLVLGFSAGAVLWVWFIIFFLYLIIVLVTRNKFSFLVRKIPYARRQFIKVMFVGFLMGVTGPLMFDIGVLFLLFIPIYIYGLYLYYTFSDTLRKNKPRPGGMHNANK